MYKRQGYIFSGWNTEPDGTGSFYDVGVSIDIDTPLYAQWTKPAPPITPNTLTYNGSEQPLVTKKTGETRTVEYIVGGTEPTADSSAWSSTIPKETNAGTYTVWYKATPADGGEPTIGAVTVTINKADVTITWDSTTHLTKNWIYDGQAHALCSGISANGGTVYYAVSGAGTTENAVMDPNKWATTVPTAKDVGYYKVWYKVVGDENHNNIGITNIKDSNDTTRTTVIVAKADSSVETAPKAVPNLKYTGGDLTLVSEGTADGGTMQYKIGENGTWIDTLPTTKNAGKYTVYYRVKGDDNHNDTDGSTSVEAEIKQATPTVTVEKNDNLTYNGKDQQLVTTSGVPEGCTVPVSYTHLRQHNLFLLR